MRTSILDHTLAWAIGPALVLPLLAPAPRPVFFYWCGAKLLRCSLFWQQLVLHPAENFGASGRKATFRTEIFCFMYSLLLPEWGVRGKSVPPLEGLISVHA